MQQHDPIPQGSHFVTGMRIAAARLAPRRLWVIATLTLALAVGSAGQLPRTQAAPAGNTSIDIWLTAKQVGGKHTLCVGDEVSIRVTVWERTEVVGEVGGGYGLGRLGGVEVVASVDGSGVGTISPAAAMTKMSMDSRADFTFTAEKPGTTVVHFQAKVNTHWLLGLLELGGNNITADVPLMVEDCKYKVTAVSRWSIPGGIHINYVATIDVAGMTEDSDRGGHYVGTASVTWQIANGTAGDCSSTQSAGPSEAWLEGQVHGDDLAVTVFYNRVVVSNHIVCRNSEGEINGDYDYSLYPDTFVFSVSASGGMDGHKHNLLEPEGTISGLTVGMVEWVTGQ
jgi:hypothetical protein